MSEYGDNVPRQESGKPIQATTLAAMADRINRTGRDHRAIDLTRKRPLLPAGDGSGLKCARITDRVGSSPPFLYSGEEVTYVGSVVTVVDDSADDLGWAMKNAYEQNSDGVSGARVETGAIVLYSSVGDFFLFERSPYKGTLS